jgi:hypothetical protein
MAADPVYLVELTAKVWPQYLRSGLAAGIGSWHRTRTRVACSVGSAYTQTAVLRRSASANGAAYVGIAVWDAAGNLIGGFPWIWVAANGVTPGTGWTTYTSAFGFGTATPLPAGAAFMAPGVALNYANTAGTHDIMDVVIVDNTAPAVVLNRDRYFRESTEWEWTNGPLPGTFLTLVGGDALAQALTLRYATRQYMTYDFDTPARAQYDARVMQAGLLRMELPAGQAGSIVSSYGQIVLNNSDGALSGLAYYGLDGQPFRVLRGAANSAYSDFVEVMRGTMQQAVVDRKLVSIRLAGREALLDQPMLRARYLGNNALPNGLEGNPDLAGQPKPMLQGAVRGIQPVCVNTSRFIYQVGVTLDLLFVLNVYVAGVGPMTEGAAYTSQADMETNAPAAGTYRTWRAGGYFRLGTAPAGVVTCDADNSPTSYGTGHWWWKHLFYLARNAGLDSTGGTGEIQFTVGATFPVPDNWPSGSWPANQPYVGVWVNDPRTTWRQAMSQIAVSLGAWFGFIHWAGAPGASLKFGGEIFPPSSAALTVANYPVLNSSNVSSIAGIADPGEGRGVPAYSVELGYSPNYTVHTPSMAPTVSPLALGLLAIKSRRLTVTDAAVQTKHLTARAMVRETAMTDDPAGVGYEAARLLELQRYPRQWYELTASLAAVLEMPNRPRLGGYVYLSWPGLGVLKRGGVVEDFGWFSVTALEIDFAKNQLRLTVRQATEQAS